MANVDELIKDFKATLNRMLSTCRDIEEQRSTARAMISIFQARSQQTGVLMVKYAAEVIRDNYPHLKEDVEKLLILI